MEPLEAEAAIVDDFLLNISEDLFLDHDSSSSSLLQHHQQHKAQAGPAQQQQHQHPPERHGENRLPLPHEDPFLTNFPQVEEKELEWMTRTAAFPTFDFIPVTMPFSARRPPRKEKPEPGGGGGDTKRPSPVSVLEAAGGTWPVRKRSKAPRRLRAVLPVFRVDPHALALAPDVGPGAGSAPPLRRCCWHCRAEETPQWRAGPAGPKTLCNACGVRYKSGRLVPEYRPASSPTFSSDLHSNSHRKIIEMRRRKSLGGSPQPPSPLGPAGASAAPPATVKTKKKRKRKKEGDDDDDDNQGVLVVAPFV